MNDSYLKGNKDANRPHYYCFKEETTGLFWMIPLSSRIDKYRKIINKKIANGKPCDILHIMKLDNNKESVFLIQDIVKEKLYQDRKILNECLMLLKH